MVITESLISNLKDITEKDISKHILKARVRSIIPVPFKDNEGNKSILIQSFADYQLDDNKNGYGSFETLRKIKK